jgi:hypothetical protein
LNFTIARSPVPIKTWLMNLSLVSTVDRSEVNMAPRSVNGLSVEMNKVPVKNDRDLKMAYLLLFQPLAE